MRLHKPSGQGFVVLNGSKPIYLGRYDRDGTQEAYYRLIAEWKADGCRPPARPSAAGAIEREDGLTTSRISTLRVRAPGSAGGIKGAMVDHCRSVRSDGYDVCVN